MNCTEGHDWTPPDDQRHSICRRCGSSCTRDRDGTIATFDAGVRLSKLDFPRPSVPRTPDPNSKRSQKREAARAKAIERERERRQRMPDPWQEEQEKRLGAGGR